MKAKKKKTYLEARIREYEAYCKTHPNDAPSYTKPGSQKK